jgi:hypothetical protein
MRILRRISPAILLFFLAPLIAEFLLGDLTIEQLPALFALAPLYGGGAILIRELVRRTGRSWPTFLLFALAYALMEEALLTQSLFNPNYLHLRLIDYGFVPALGSALPWAIFVLGIHICWSLAVPIGLVESLFWERRTVPWLKLPGLLMVFVLLSVGALLVLRFSLGQTPFRASSIEILVSGLLVLIAVAAAFLVFRREPAAVSPGRAPVHPLIIGTLTLLGGSAFVLANSQGKARLPWPATALLEVAVAAALVGFFAWANAGRRWTAAQTWSAATGGMLCYAWLGYTVDRGLHGPGHAASHSVFVVAALLVAAWAGLRVFRQAPSSDKHHSPNG